MKVYQVEIEIEEKLVKDFEEYMIKLHIPELMKTGLFRGYIFSRKDLGSYQVQYFSDEKSLEKYFLEFAPKFRKDFSSRFPDVTRISRKVLEVLSHSAD
ncbi:MAG: DUF4286 family protein [Pyrinomonadaceae bacterium]|nr:DUF4286 family protein [Pyrinomonadaceae bacterium]MCX7639920.1 DUF4286 family protein [Pyrinomonadaceae bacterium]MDW8304092.1 DUF4286 family protein [Acidobacteriota bacterium]